MADERKLNGSPSINKEYYHYYYYYYYYYYNAREHSICIRINVNQLSYIQRPKSPPSPLCHPAIMLKNVDVIWK